MNTPPNRSGDPGRNCSSQRNTLNFLYQTDQLFHVSAVDCPTCGTALATERGMRQHHTKIHTEPLPNRTCSGCGDDFYDPKSRREYCDDCNPNAGEHNGNWKAAKEHGNCERCGVAFEYYPSDEEGIYCPECVEEADDFLGDPYSEVVDVERIRRECDHCNQTLPVLAPERKHGAGRFCSLECLSRWMSVNRQGENHHQWIEGERKYAGNWWQARRNPLRRDGYKCQHCGKTSAEIGRNPDVHHIIPLREWEDPQEAHQLDNLVSLCRVCHRNAEANNIDIAGPGTDHSQG